MTFTLYCSKINGLIYPPTSEGEISNSFSFMEDTNVMTFKVRGIKSACSIKIVRWSIIYSAIGLFLPLI